MSAKLWLWTARPLGFSQMVFPGHMGTAPPSVPGIVRAPRAHSRGAADGTTRPPAPGPYLHKQPEQQRRHPPWQAAHGSK